MPSQTPGASSRPPQGSSLNKRLTLGLLAAFALAGAGLPLWLAGQGQRVDQSKRLGNQVGVRGAFSNTGSRDAGPDPAYQPKA